MILLRLFSCFIAFTAVAQSAATFGSTVYPVFNEANCRGCHVQGGLAGSTRLRFPAADATAERIEEFGRTLISLVNRSAPEQSLLLLKPTNREKHTGGQLIKPGSREEAVLLTWMRGLPATAVATAPRTGEVAGPTLRRLTHSQYNNTVRDLLGDDSRPADRFPSEDYVHGFKNQASAQDISPILAEAYNSAAERLAKAAFHGGVDNNKLIPCAAKSHEDASCRAAFVRSFGLRAFRRPLTASEQIRYEQAFQRGAQANRSFTEGAQIVVEAMLQSPKFLFHMNGGAAQNRAWTIASRLSYFLWDTMPDAALFDAAASGELLTSPGLKASIKRVLADPRAHQGLDEFISQWLRFDLALGAVKDRALFPQFTPELAAAMAEEARLLIHDIARDGRSFMEVFTAGHAFVTSELASLYGVPRPATEFAKVTLPAESGRAGIIGQALFLAMTSKPGETSPTVRGSFIREHFLCQQIPDPPPGTNANLPPLSEATPQTTRQRLSEHTTNATCRGCHNLMDPIGFGFEHYDGIGLWRDLDRGVPVDATGEIFQSRDVDGPFDGVVELGQKLAASDQVRQCVATQWFRFGFGRPEQPEDQCNMDQIQEAFEASGYNIRELLVALTQTDAFRYRHAVATGSGQ